MGKGDIGDGELAALAKCPNLEYLAFAGKVYITDAGLDHLKTASALRHLDIKNSTVSEGSVKDLANALPTCKIIWSNGVLGPSDRGVPPNAEP